MSSNEPTVEQDEQARVGPEAACLRWIAAMCGGMTRQSPGCGSGISAEQPEASETKPTGPSCCRGATQRGTEAPAPEFI